MFDFEWMIGRVITEVNLHEPEFWVFVFQGGGSISVECPWRILEEGHIAVSRDDHNQQFGLPSPIDAATLAREVISGMQVLDVKVNEGTADLTIKFAQQKELQIIPQSSGYESWQMQDPNGHQIVAQGGGQLSAWNG